MPSNHNIFQRIRQRVPQMKLTGYIRWRHDDDKRSLFTIYLRSKIAMLHPEAIPLLLNFAWLVSLWNFRHIKNSSYKVMRPLRVAHHTTSKPLNYNYLFPKKWVTLSRILSATSRLGNRGNFSILPLRSIITTWLVSAPMPLSLAVMSLATIRSSRFFSSFPLALATRFSLSAAKPTRRNLPLTSPSISCVFSSSSAKPEARSRLILLLETFLGR